MALSVWALAPAAGAVARHPPKPAAPLAKRAPQLTPFEAVEAAARAGDAEAQTRLGDDYLLGREGLAKNMVQAREWYQKAAAQNQPDAAFVLGEIYWNGDGIPKDRTEAARWWKVAFEHGRSDAAKLLGDEAFNRARAPDESAWDVPALQEALGWYEKAAAVAGPELQGEAQDRVRLVRQLIEVAQGRAG